MIIMIILKSLNCYINTIEEIFVSLTGDSCSEVKLMITKVPGPQQRFVDDATAHLSFGENREKFAEVSWE